VDISRLKNFSLASSATTLDVARFARLSYTVLYGNRTIKEYNATPNYRESTIESVQI
jgi:hypothetical protein